MNDFLEALRELGDAISQSKIVEILNPISDKLREELEKHDLNSEMPLREFRSIVENLCKEAYPTDVEQKKAKNTVERHCYAGSFD